MRAMVNKMRMQAMSNKHHPTKEKLLPSEIEGKLRAPWYYCKQNKARTGHCALTVQLQKG